MLCSSNAYHLGLVLEHLDRRVKARQAYLWAIKLRASNEEAQQAVVRLSMKGPSPHAGE